jgi:hypothetical protein
LSREVASKKLRFPENKTLFNTLRRAGSKPGQCLDLAVAAVCDRRKTALIERRYNSNFEIRTLPKPG